MKNYTNYSPDEKQKILQQYQPRVRGKGFKALARNYKIKGGHKVLRKWYKKWDGTKNSLEKQSGGDRRSILTQKEKQKHIKQFVDKQAQFDAVNYSEVKVNIENKTGKEISLRTVQEKGKELGISSKRTKRTLESQGKC
jgi:transposase